MGKYQAVVLHRADYRTTDWSGGKTTELAIEPADSLYADRNFTWRLSSATVEVEESTFTDLPDYDRIIMTLCGEIDLRHDGGEWMHFQECTPYDFDGGADTESRGRVTDFNLMLRKGKCTGLVVPLRMQPAEQTSLGSVIAQDMPGADEFMLYCYKGHLAVRDGRSIYALAAGDTLRLTGDFRGQEWSCRATDGVVAVAAAVQYL